MESPRRLITVVGAGYVGLVTAVGLVSLGHRVELVETGPDRLRSLRQGRIPIHEAGLQEALDAFLHDRLTIVGRPQTQPDVVMICVGTPISADGRSDLSQLRSALQSTAKITAGRTPLVIRSTLPPGMTRRVLEWSGVPTERVLTNPEFLRQGTALADFLAPARIVIGHFPDATPAVIELVSGLYDRLDAPRLVVDIAAAEVIKNGANAFLALKLSFVNELAALCEQLGTDVDVVLDGITRDPRIGRDYMRPSFGFGGSCLPKELKALAVAGWDAGLDMHVTVAASEANEASQARFARHVIAAAGGVAGRTVGMLGLAFKAGTDDVRDSPAIEVARQLVDAGALVRAHDPEAAANALRALPGLQIAETPMAALDGAHVAVLATDWPAYQDLPWAAIRDGMAQRVIVDGRRVLDTAALRALGFDVTVLGSGPMPGDRPATRQAAPAGSGTREA